MTAVEYKKDILETYGELFPNDELVHGDAVEYLESNFEQFDFIWASPPCPSHSRIRKMGVDIGQVCPLVPDMTLYGIIIFLKTYFKGKYLVENVKPYYEPLIKPTAKLQRHYFWSNFDIPEMRFDIIGIEYNNLKDYEMWELIKNKSIKNRTRVLRNCVNNQLGLYILECAIKEFTAVKLNTPLFEE